MGISKERIFLSYYCPEFIETTPNVNLRRELFLPSEKFIVGMVAYMYPPRIMLGQRRGIKGHEDFIEAISLIRKRGREITGVVVGGAYGKARKYEMKIKRDAKKKCGESIRFLGIRKDVIGIYPDFNAVVHPSLSESLGGSGESLMLGVPTITTNVGGFPDVIEHRKTGWLVLPRHPEQIADAICEIMDDRKTAQQIAENGRRRALEMFNLVGNTKKIFEIYCKLI